MNNETIDRLIAAVQGNIRRVDYAFEAGLAPSERGDRVAALGADFWDCLSGFQRRHKVRADYVRAIESSDAKDHPFTKVLHPEIRRILASDHDHGIQQCVVHFRGLRSERPRLSFFEPDISQRKRFITAYETVQNGSRHTLNSVLAGLSLCKEAADERVQVSRETAADPGSILLIANLVPGNAKALKFGAPAAAEGDVASSVKVTLEIGRDFASRTLLPNGTSVLREIRAQSRRRHYDSAAVTTLRDEFDHCRRGLLLDLRRQDTMAITNELEGMCSFFLGEPALGAHPDVRRDTMLQVLQGVAVMLLEYGPSLICLTSQAKYANRFSFSGQVFAFLDKRAPAADECLLCLFSYADLFQRIFFADSFECLDALAHDSLATLQNAKRIWSTGDRVDQATFSYDVLESVIEMATLIAPLAKHEGRPINVPFIVAHPYLLKSGVVDIASTLGSIEDADALAWSIREPRASTNEEQLMRARARILGNCQLLQKAGRALFVNCDADAELVFCSHLVEMHSAVGRLGPISDLETFSQQNRDLFVVQVRGQKRIEVWHRGTKRLVWTPSGGWGEEQTWNERSLYKALLAQLDLPDNEGDERSRRANIVAHTAAKIANSDGEGASFVICATTRTTQRRARAAIPMRVAGLVAKLTAPFPDKGEGCLDFSGDGVEDLREVSVQDGGTIVDLTTGRFFGRMQWLPTCAKGRPFRYDYAVVPREAYSEFEQLNDREGNSTGSPAPLELPPEWERRTAPLLCDFWRHKGCIKTPSGKQVENKLRWNRWYCVLQWGTRHMSSLGMSVALWGSAVVVTVSADGHVTVFNRGCEVLPELRREGVTLGGTR
jgi:hypothetical protein